jgi:hypothetical protein
MTIPCEISPTVPKDEYDTPWKEAVTRYFPEFIQFYFPDVSARIDWSKGYQFLDQELAQVVKDAELGKRLIDKLVQVTTHENANEWVYIHIEIQGSHDHLFAQRIFTYNYRLYDKYRRPIASLALLADDRTRWKPKHYGYELFGCRMGIHFPVAKLLDYHADLEALLINPNPFALVTAAHLLTRQTKRNPQQRYAAKWRLAKLLYERDWDKQRIIDLFSVLDWMMQVPPELQRQLWHEIDQLERIHQMPYITSVERIGMEKGLQIGLQQGLLEGKIEGKREGELTLLLRQLNKRFGPINEAHQLRLNHATQEQLEYWAERVLDAQTIDEVFESH